MTRETKMLRHKQLIEHDPKAGLFGDCYRTCVAIVMGLEPEDVPHVYNGETGDFPGITGLRGWLRPLGFGIWQNIYPPSEDLGSLLHSQSILSPEIPVIITGMGARGVNHCVVAIDGEIFCDPYSGDANPDPFTGPAEGDGETWWWIEVIARHGVSDGR